MCGGARDGVDACNMVVRAGETFRVGQISVRVMETPCHTTGHVLYRVGGGVAGGAGGGALFSGDCLFTAGCGRFFEGSASEMFTNFIQFRRLPPDTLVFPGHEYTISNLKFAAFVDPENSAVSEKLVWARAQRQSAGGSRPTVPSTLAEEYTYNPFLRCGERSIRQRLASVKECQLSVEDLNAAPNKSGSNSSSGGGGGDSKKHDSPDESADPLLPVSGGKTSASGGSGGGGGGATGLALIASNIRVLAELRRLRNADVHIPPGGNDDE